MRTHGTGVKYFHHHVVGDLTLARESVELLAEPGLTMTVYAAEPGSPTSKPWRSWHPGRPRTTRSPATGSQRRGHAGRTQPERCTKPTTAD